MSNPRTIRSIAIVNRGEAAMRCLRAVKSLRARERSDLTAIVLYTDVDRDSPFVRHADVAIELRHRGSAVTAYLDRDGLLEAILRAGADAVWPGWGFLAEDPAFAERVERAGVRFLGPAAETMRQLGDKISAKLIAEAACVPVAPWSGGAIADCEAAAEAAERIGYPLMIKASAGGGGRGIRSVDSPADLAEAARSAGAEAVAAFGDDRLFLEQKISGGRHVEVQIAGDLHGHVITLGCRDCSVQRRHQKLIEEAPPFGISAETRQEIEAAAVRLARRVGYSGVGTVEFLFTGEGYFFLEVNPRLQVEHGVTEAVTGIDLVELQIRIGRGEEIGDLEVHESGAAIEARVCAEDPAREFLPAPGRVARFDPPLGAGVRVDTGVVAGSRVSADFDSLIAKVIATGRTREEARARLVYELRDFELVIAAGATNKSFLIDLLESRDFREGAIDTGWVDRRARERREPAAFAAPALVAAAVLLYQDERRMARINFFADPTNASPARVSPSSGQEIDLSYEGQPYRLRVLALGSWRYRLVLDGTALTATLQEHGSHGARLLLGGRELRVLYDMTDAAVRVEVEGAAHRFARQAAGTVAAGSPAVVVAVHVRPGERVLAGQPLGLLEAMKMEIAFRSPLPGTVVEVKARKGQQVAAGEALVIVEPEGGGSTEGAGDERVRFVHERDRLELFFVAGRPTLEVAAASDPATRRRAVESLREDIRGLFLGYDCDPEHAAEIIAVLESPLDGAIPAGFRDELSVLRHELTVFADVERLFSRVPRPTPSGEIGPSNEAQLRRYLRRMRAGGAGIAEEFLTLLERALRHYGIAGLSHDDALERAVLRLFASQRERALRHRTVAAVMRLTAALGAANGGLEDDRELAGAFSRIARLRGLVPDAIADLAIETGYTLFEAPEIERQNAAAWRSARADLESAPQGRLEVPPALVLRLATAPWSVFERIASWISGMDERYRLLAAAAYVCRWYAPNLQPALSGERVEGEAVERILLPDGRVVLGAVVDADRLSEAVQRFASTLSERVAAVEVLVPPRAGVRAELPPGFAADWFRGGFFADRLTVDLLSPTGDHRHVTFVRRVDGTTIERNDLHFIHPEVASRVGLDRLGDFALERLAGAEGVYVFHGRSRATAGDERIFVVAQVRAGETPAEDPEAATYVAAFVQAFYEAVRTLRSTLIARDPQRRLQWNRITLCVEPELYLDAATVQSLARRLAPSTRHLGLEKIVVRLNLIESSARPSRPVEIVFSDPSGRMEVVWRTPHVEPLRPAGDYERRVAEARRRGVSYPYEVIRMLTAGANEADHVGPRAALPPGTFDEYDLASDGAAPKASSVNGRPYGANVCGVVFGLITTPTQKVPEGMRRVLILSDPTRNMGALAAAECDRIVAALDLAESLSLPVEWLPVSSGARIAMDSGTENLDATARVVRRIVTFTQRGGTIHVIVHGVNVGAQSYFDALATMLLHTRGVLIMTRSGSMVLTGKAALEASGSVAGEDEAAIGGLERIMAPNGQAQYYAADLLDAYTILYDHYRYTYVVPGEERPRRQPSADVAGRTLSEFPCGREADHEFRTVGEIFDSASNPGRRRPFSMRAVMAALVDWDGGRLERWRSMSGAETAIVWDAHLGGHPVCVIGVESRNVARDGTHPPDGPSVWNGGTLFPLSSKKVARALNAASGNRPVVILANLSGFDGSPESMRKLQLEYGAEIARAVVNFDGPLLFVVVSRYHGGAYVVFSRSLNAGLRAFALDGSFASVIGGGPAATVVFSRDVRARAERDERVREARRALEESPGGAARAALEQIYEDVLAEKRAELAAEFDSIHTVERARAVRSLEEIVPAAELRPFLVRILDVDREKRSQDSQTRDGAETVPFSPLAVGQRDHY
jgi:acetyl/propionyl-CoA carboxylase alpha subunit/acetyl-CoA carboxylase carboxyltransferase component